MRRTHARAIGIVSPPAQCLAVRDPPDNAIALRIMDALIRALELRGRSIKRLDAPWTKVDGRRVAAP